MRRALLAAAGALVLAGCPLPQPLPDYPAGSITPPRILTDPLFASSSAVLFVPADCATTEPSYELNVNIKDTNTIESIEARWFVNYDARFEPNYTVLAPETVQPNADPTNLVRTLKVYRFRPYQWPEIPGSPVAVKGADGKYASAGVLRTVELVVSNGFDARTDQTELRLPNRTPLDGWETQVYRWVFMTVPESAAVPCPAP